MRKTFFIIASILFSIQFISAQDIKKMFEEDQYQSIIDLYANNPEVLSSEDLMYIAQSYMSLGDIQNGLTFANRATQKESNNARTYFVTGVLYNADGNYDNAIKVLEKAITLAPKEANYHAALGDSYYGQEKHEDALLHYKKATNLKPASEKAFFMIASIYATEKKDDESLKAFYKAKDKIANDKELYVTVLYNIGKMEYDKGSYKKAINAYNDLISYLPDDYYSYEKLIQCYYGLNQMDKADKEKAKLYAAYKNGYLEPTSIFDRFCFDHFKIGDKEVVAYERYEDYIYDPIVKRIFYVVDNLGNVITTIYQNSITYNRYNFTTTKNGIEYTYTDEALGLYPKYSALKAFISDIVTNKLTATSFE